MGIIRDKKAFAVFLLPGFLFYLFAVFYPIEESLRMSFMKWNGIGDKVFVGFSNYMEMFQDKVFYEALINNMIYLLIVVVMQLSIGLLFAILLTYMTKGVTLVKTLYYVPCIVTTVAVTQLFRSIYSIEPLGLLNQLLQAMGLDHLAASWLTNPNTVLAAVSVPEGWRFTGMYMVIFYAALVSLDPSVYEAAKVDGASELQVLLKIKLPLIKDILLLTLTMCLTGALRGFDIPFLLTGGGPGSASELMSTYMYKKTFSSNQYGYGSTLAVFIIIESILIVFVLRKCAASREDREIASVKPTVELSSAPFALPLSVMMFVNFYSFVPNELIEAAIVDGCTPYRVFAKVVFPLARNTVITIASMYSILIWNDFIFANTFINDSKAKTVAMGLKDYVGAFAAIAISILPPLIIYFALNKWVTAGMTMGATKG